MTTTDMITIADGILGVGEHFWARHKNDEIRLHKCDQMCLANDCGEAITTATAVYVRCGSLLFRPHRCYKWCANARNDITRQRNERIAYLENELARERERRSVWSDATEYAISSGAQDDTPTDTPPI